MADNRFFLNALRESGRSLKTPPSGAWASDAEQKQFLKSYAGDIVLKGSLDDASLAHSVPSVFARPIQFAQALADTDNPFHLTFVRQWRGLLAVFALGGSQELRLDLKEYRVPAPAEGESSKVGERGRGNLHLRTMIGAQLPAKKEDWRRFWMIRCGERLVGATSPWTIVYTPAQYDARNVVPWTDDKGLLVDPADHFDPNRSNKSSYDLYLLRRWVEIVRAAHPWGFDKDREAQSGVLNALLDSWLKDLAMYRREGVEVAALTPYLDADDGPHPAWLAYAPSQSRPDSNLAMASRKAGNIILLSRSKTKPTDQVAPGVLASQIDWTTVISPKGFAFRTKGGKEIKAEYVVPEDAFFPPRLLEYKLSSSALVRGESGLATPLTPEYFKYETYETLVSRSDLLRVQQGGSTVKVSLQIQLADGSLRTFEKQYDRKNEVVNLNSERQSFAIWPEFCASDWDGNLAAYAGPVESDGEKPLLRVTPLYADGTEEVHGSTQDKTQENLRIWNCGQPAMGFSLRFKTRRDGSDYAAGVLLRSEMKAPKALVPERTWEVAVDFGTSSTTLMVRKDHGRIETLPLTGHTVFLTLEDGNRDARESIDNNLYPSTRVVPPFRTILYEARATYPGVSKRTYSLQFNFLPNVMALPVANLKWKAGTGDAEPLRQYLGGLVRYILCEARSEGVGKVEFRWSFPLSLPVEVRENMENFWKTLSSRYVRSVGATAAGSAPVTAEGASAAGVAAGEASASGDSPQRAASSSKMNVTVLPPVSESEALSRSLAWAAGSVVAAQEAVTMAIDVGGGSADVGFWSGSKLEDQFSFKLAGNDILDPFVHGRSDLIDRIYRICSEGAEMPVQLRDRLSDRASLLANSLLTQAKVWGQPYTGSDPHNHPATKAIHGSESAGEAPWLQVRTMAYLYFSGLAFYMGLHARTISGGKSFSLYLGGRGASLLAWVTNSPATAGEIMAKCFIAGLRQGTDDKFVPPSVSLMGAVIGNADSAPALKTEVATGLLEEPLIDEEIARRETTLVGEKEWTDTAAKAKIEWDQRVDSKGLARLAPPPNFDSSYISAFQKEIVNGFPQIIVDRDNLKGLSIDRARVSALLQLSLKESKDLLQPVFAAELKALMQLYAERAGGIISR